MTSTRLGPPRITRKSYGGESSMRYYAYVQSVEFLRFFISSAIVDARECREGVGWSVVVWKSRGKVFYFFFFPFF